MDGSSPFCAVRDLAWLLSHCHVGLCLVADCCSWGQAALCIVRGFSCVEYMLAQFPARRSVSVDLRTIQQGTANCLPAILGLSHCNSGQVQSTRVAGNSLQEQMSEAQEVQM